MSAPPRRWKKNICVRQPRKEMVFLSERVYQDLGGGDGGEQMSRTEEGCGAGSTWGLEARLTAHSDHDGRLPSRVVMYTKHKK